MTKVPARVRDETGRVYSELTVTCYAGNDASGRAKWRCTCSCGATLTVYGSKLRSGGTRSCGHLRGQNGFSVPPQNRGITHRGTVRKHDRIVEMLTTEPMTMESIAAKIHLSLVATYRRVKRLREEGRVVIAKWVRDVKDGRPTAMYRAKSGKWSKDARKPDGLTVKERKVRARKAEQDVSSVRLRAAETLKEVKVLVRSKKPGQWWE